MKINLSSKLVNLVVIVSTLLISACNNDNYSTPTPVPVPDPTPIAKQFSVTVTNLTYNQPLSPIALITHVQGSMWTLNQPASAALELMAESGDNSMLLSEDYVDNSVSGGGVLMPGLAETIVIESNQQGDLMLSLATMLVNTNDAFSGATALDVTNLANGDSMKYRLPAYDAGTEVNSEAAGTIPGPADSGEGFNASRETSNFVTMHAGVVSVDDGATTSILNQSHRFDNPVVQVAITRTR